ncbi:hypothetical protein [Corynebacterium falsenii]|uniref:DUF308 domain-containing protein n=1 Tax=Corynebacterium falsenii TaxID=108486 RepID=A0A418Q8Q7_9CORY|nr:hypothetical protein [Corynebacterium falsenii]AHI03233.1 membrane protein [Corynebacterium falsenii DSM 44353]MDC7103445.1 DUF308 domain-containing protein [Corynebacterium falsenii]RIX35745.1 DUF308 domain-containing protein [Corynebacterium falsenii]UBI03929.1 DUF308 domain-containing protein [Corynebacterium falsenii]UBI06059.1 DUF308 domain-containing protein [Corynebacterium falsenii]
MAGNGKNAGRNYSDLDRSQAREDARRVITPQKVSGLSLAALIVGILCIPASIMAVIGIVVAMVGIVVGVTAVVVASRRGTQRSYAIGGLVLSIVAMAIAIFFTQAGLSAVQGCDGLRGEEFQQCVRDNQQ